MRGTEPRRCIAASLIRAPQSRVHGLWVVLTMAAGSLRAAPGASLEVSERAALSVERGLGAESCPSVLELERLVAELRPSSPEYTGRYHVAFSRDSHGYRARIENSKDGSARQLFDQQTSCHGLARATAVTLALLFDAQAPAAPETGTPPPPTTNTASPEKVPAPASAPLEASETTPQEPSRAQSPVVDNHTSEPGGERNEWSFGVYVGPGALTGVVGPVAPVGWASVDVMGRSLRFEVGGLATLPLDRDLAPGRVTLGLLAGSAQACVTPVRLDATRLDVCSGAVVGRVSAQARGYTQNETGTRGWLAIPVGLTLTNDTPLVGWQLGAQALLPMRQQDFRIDGLGTVYRSSAVAAFAYVRASLRWLL